LSADKVFFLIDSALSFLRIFFGAVKEKRILRASQLHEKYTLPAAHKCPASSEPCERDEQGDDKRQATWGA